MRIISGLPSTRLRPRLIFLSLAHTQEFRCLIQAQNDAYNRRHLSLLWIDENLRSNKPNIAAPMTHFATTCRQNVLHPIDARPICQREHEVVASLKHVDRRSIPAAALASQVFQNAESWYPAREQPGNRIDDVDSERAHECQSCSWRHLVLKVSLIRDSLFSHTYRKYLAGLLPSERFIRE